MRLLRTASGSAHRPPFVPKMVRRCSATREYTASRMRTGTARKTARRATGMPSLAKVRRTAVDLTWPRGRPSTDSMMTMVLRSSGILALRRRARPAGLCWVSKYTRRERRGADETRVAAARRAVPVDEGHQRRGGRRARGGHPRPRARTARGGRGQGCARTRAPRGVLAGARSVEGLPGRLSKQREGRPRINRREIIHVQIENLLFEPC